MADEFEVAEARKARAERAVNGMIEYLLLLTLVSAAAVGGLSLVAWAMARWYLAIAARLAIP